MSASTPEGFTGSASILSTMIDGTAGFTSLSTSSSPPDWASSTCACGAWYPLRNRHRQSALTTYVAPSTVRIAPTPQWSYTNPTTDPAVIIPPCTATSTAAFPPTSPARGTTSCSSACVVDQ